MVKFAVTTRLGCSASMYITDKDTAVYKKFHVRPLPPAQTCALNIYKLWCRCFLVFPPDIFVTSLPHN